MARHHASAAARAFVALLLVASAATVLVGCSSSSTSSVDIPANGDAASGAKIFSQGQTASGPVAFTGGGPTTGNGACMNCHGANAEGKFAPSITYDQLLGKTKTAKSPRFVFASDSQIYTAVTEGVAPNGSQLRPAMPKFKLAPQDLADLLAFLKTK